MPQLTPTPVLRSIHKACKLHVRLTCPTPTPTPVLRSMDKACKLHGTLTCPTPTPTPVLRSIHKACKLHGTQTCPTPTPTSVLRSIHKVKKKKGEVPVVSLMRPWAKTRSARAAWGVDTKNIEPKLSTFSTKPPKTCGTNECPPHPLVPSSSSGTLGKVPWPSWHQCLFASVSWVPRTPGSVPGRYGTRQKN